MPVPERIAANPRVPCRQCGALTELEPFALSLVRRFDGELADRGEEPLARDELVTCGDEDCERAEQALLRERLAREQAELDAILERVRNGEHVVVPAALIRWRPSDYEQIQRAVKAARRAREEAGE